MNDLVGNFACTCAEPYLGAQVAGTPLRCERCRGLVGDGKQQEARGDSVWPNLGRCKELAQLHSQSLGCKEWQPIAARQANQPSQREVLALPDAVGAKFVIANGEMRFLAQAIMRLDDVPSHASGEPGQDDGFMEWWLSVGIKEMPRGDEPPEHAAIARLAWDAASKQMAEKAAQLVAKWRKIAAECPSKYRNKWRDVFEAVETCASELEAAARELGASERR